MWKILCLLQDQRPAGGEGSEPPARRKFRMVAEFVVLYCGSQRGMVDQVSLVLFPICFILFTIVYWISYVSESRIRANVWPEIFEHSKLQPVHFHPFKKTMNKRLSYNL
jgi:hypothetical protein